MTALTGPRRVAAGLGLALRAVFAAAVTAGIVGGVPWLLLTQVGWPLPRHLPTTRAGWEQWLTNPPIDPEQFITNALACALWFFWAQFLLCVLAETWYLLRRQAPSRVRLALRPVQGVTAGLVGAITLTLLTRPVPAKTTPEPVALEVDTGPAVPGAEGTHPGRPPAATPAAGPGVTLTPGAYWTHPAPPATADGGPATRHGLRSYVVREHDSLWRIADRELGDPLRWKDIYTLNHDRPQPDGDHLTGPYYLIRPGWRLLLPHSRADGQHPPAEQAGRLVEVHSGDTLSLIAQRELGDAERWPELFDLNQGRPQPDGRRLEDPDLILPGWTITLPPDHPHPGPPPGDGPAAGGPGAPTTGPRSPGAPVSPDPGRPTPTPPAWPHAPAPSTAVPSAPAAGAPNGASATSGRGGGTHPPSAASTPAAAPSAEPEVRLPTGGLVGLSVAAGVGTAVALWRRRSRIRRRPTTAPETDQPPTGPATPSRATAAQAGGRDVSGAEVPPAVAAGLERAWLAAVRRAARDTDPDPQDGGAEEEIEPGVPSAAALGRLGVARDRAGWPAGPPRPACPPPAGTVAVAAEAGTEVLLDVLATGGLGLFGEGAPGVARAVLAGLLAGGGTLHTHVIATAEAADLLLGDAAEVLGRVPGVEVSDDLDALLRAAEAEVFGRGRLLAAADDPTLEVYRGLDGAEPIPALVLLLPAPARPGPAARLAGVLAIGRARDVGAVLLGSWPRGMSCRIDAAGAVAQTTPPDPGGALRPRRRLHHLSAGELTDLVGGLLADARGALDFLPAPTPSPTPPDPARADNTPRPAAAEPAQDFPTGRPTEQDPPIPAGTSPGAVPQWVAAAGAPVAVGVFGPLRVFTGAGAEVSGRLRTKLRDLLAYLAVHPAGATADQLADALWPDADPRRAAERLSTTLTQLRRALREAGGLAREADPVPRVADRYRLDPALIATDHAAFTTALDTLGTHPAPPGTAAPDDQDGEARDDRAARVAAARRAADIHAAGLLLDGCDYDWAEPARHAAAARATHALTTLAAQLAEADPLQALTALHQAIDITPHEEDLYRHAMRIYGELGRLAPIRRLMRLLESHLADLDADPEPDTTRLFGYLTRALTRPDTTTTTTTTTAAPEDPPHPPNPTDPAPH